MVNTKGEPLIDTLVRPVFPIPYQVAKVHGITNEMVADAPTWWDIREEVSALLCGRTIIAYNARFDFRMIGRTCGTYRLHSSRPTGFVPCGYIRNTAIILNG